VRSLTVRSLSKLDILPTLNKRKMNRVNIYKKSIQRLEEIIGHFESELEKPTIINGKYGYKSPTLKHICFLKGVRIISGLNALLVLCQAGYVTEMGVLLRTIGECINDIYFLLEHYPRKRPEVEKYIAAFLNENVDELKIVEDEKKRTKRTKARTIIASRVRFLSEHMNLHIDGEIVYKNYDTYSGYVHACYPNIMELYDNGESSKFYISGLKDKERIKEWEKILIDFTRSTILVFGYMAEKYHKRKLIHKIREVIGWFEKQTSFTTQAT